MDWKQALRDERAVLKRIIALLLALASLAERACLRSHAVCSLMFWVLHPAAAAVLAYLDDRAEMPFRSGDVREELLAVALCFRELAFLLSHQARIGFSTKDASEINALPRDPSRILYAATVSARPDFMQPVMGLNTS